MRTQTEQKPSNFLGQDFTYIFSDRSKILTTLLLITTLYIIYVWHFIRWVEGQHGNSQTLVARRHFNIIIIPYLYWNDSVSQTPVDIPHGAPKRLSGRPKRWSLVSVLLLNMSSNRFEMAFAASLSPSFRIYLGLLSNWPRRFKAISKLVGSSRPRLRAINTFAVQKSRFITTAEAKVSNTACASARRMDDHSWPWERQ